MKAHIVYTPGDDNSSIKVNGVELKDITHGVKVSFSAGELPKIEIEVAATECEITVEGDITINSTLIPEDLAMEFYEGLKKRFDVKESL